MKLSSPRRAQAAAGACAALLLLVGLPGCQGRKIVARVNNEPIYEDNYTERALTTRGQQLVPMQNLEVGAAVLIEMIKEELTHQLAGRKKVSISDEALRQIASYEQRVNPQIGAALREGALKDTDVIRQMRVRLEQFGIGVEGARMDEAELKAEYAKSKEQLKVPEIWAVRMMALPSEAAAKQALQAVQGGRPWAAVAQEMLQIAPLQAQQAGRENYILAANLKRDYLPLYNALANLKENQFIAQPVKVPNAQVPNAPPQFIIAQFVRKDPEYNPSFEQVRLLMEQKKLAETRTDWETHANTELATFTRDSNIQINIERYKPLLATFILPQATTHAPPALGGAGGMMQPPAGGTAPPPGAAGNGTGAPGGAGAVPPPTGGQ